MTVPLRSAAISCASVRAMMSVPPPAANGTTILMAWSGNSARAAVAVNCAATARVASMPMARREPRWTPGKFSNRPDMRASVDWPWIARLETAARPGISIWWNCGQWLNWREMTRIKAPSDRYVPRASPSNRSLERGVALLRAFRPGSELLGNGELAERTGLSRATVSRLSQTLLRAGYLEYEPVQRAYRLGAAVLSLGHAMRTGSSVLRVAAPPMQALARRMRVNVGLAVRDGDEMVYLESFRFNARASQRLVVSGHRVPIELTALGRAWLAVAAGPDRAALLTRLKARGRKRWPAIEADITEAGLSVERRGFCF